MARRLLLSTLLLLHTCSITAITLPSATNAPINILPPSPNNISIPSNMTLVDRSTGWSPAVALQDSQGVCPQWAWINCQSITESNYCCGSGTYCAYGGEANHIGCCADADTCTGTPPSITTTVRVPSATATTYWTQSGTTVTELVGPAYTVTTTTTATEYVTGEPTTICSTMYAHGGDLPTTAAAECGLVLVLNGAPSRGVEGVMAASALALLNGLALVAGWMGLL